PKGKVLEVLLRLAFHFAAPEEIVDPAAYAQIAAEVKALADSNEEPAKYLMRIQNERFEQGKISAGTISGLDPSITASNKTSKLETVRDAVGWIVHSLAPTIIADMMPEAAKKAPYRDPRQHPSKFDYPLDAPMRVAVFSDFGSGHFASFNMAKVMKQRAFP